MIRPFELRDIQALRRYHDQRVFLDSSPLLTWGRTLVPARSVLPPLSAAMGVFTSVCSDDGNRDNLLLGQVAHPSGEPIARLEFLAPGSTIASPLLDILLEDLAKRVGARGAQSLIAEVEESTPDFEALRNAGFRVYARQRIWRIDNIELANNTQFNWRSIVKSDELAINLLYNGLVPSLVHQVELTPRNQLRGLVYYRDGELMAYAGQAHGPSGVWVQPFSHPESEHIQAQLSNLLHELKPRRARPVYVCVRSYQAWLEPALEELGAEPGPRQTVMVKRLAVTTKVRETFKVPAIEGRRAGITTPISPPLAEPSDAGVLSYDKTPNYR